MYLFQKGEKKQGTYSEESVNEGLIATWYIHTEQISLSTLQKRIPLIQLNSLFSFQLHMPDQRELFKQFYGRICQLDPVRVTTTHTPHN